MQIDPLPAVMIGRNSTMPFFVSLFFILILSFNETKQKTKKQVEVSKITTWCCFQRNRFGYEVCLRYIFTFVSVCVCVCTRTGDKH